MSSMYAKPNLPSISLSTVLEVAKGGAKGHLSLITLSDAHEMVGTAYVKLSGNLG